MFNVALNNFRTPSAAETILFSVSDVVTCEINSEIISELFQNNFMLYVTTNHGLMP